MTDADFRLRLIDRAEKARIRVPDAAVGRLEQYFQLLLRWNETMNLTALRLRPLSDQAVDRLFIEPLQAARLVRDTPIVWYDVGSGGGSPAIPLKIVRPAARLVMVESKARKAAFLQEVLRNLGLPATRVEDVRFEELAKREAAREAIDLVTVRAVRTDKRLFLAITSALAQGGQVLLFTSQAPARQVPEGYQLVSAERVVTTDTELVLLRKTMTDRGSTQRPFQK